MRQRGAETIGPAQEYRKGRACGPYESTSGGGIEDLGTRPGCDRGGGGAGALMTIAGGNVEEKGA